MACLWPWVSLVPDQMHGQATDAAGTVTGHVTCADTQRPARFAQITLLPAAEDAEGSGGGRGGRRMSARTDLDGGFSIPDVPQGDYFVTGQATGYINETQAVQAASNADASDVPGVPRVHVGTGGASVALVLERGAVIAGTVQWDDGTPAAGVQISTVPAPTGSATPTAAAPSANGSAGGFRGSYVGTQSDDRGRFRLMGVAPGSYLVRASVLAPMPQRNETGYSRLASLAVYAPGKVRRTDATTLTVVAGEERNDLAITLGLAGMHNVSGTVEASGGSVRSGSVLLTDAQDNSLSRTGTINSDGSFVISYVPPGSYTMRVTASSRASGRGGEVASETAVRYQPLQTALTVADSDVTGVTVTVTAAAASTP